MSEGKLASGERLIVDTANPVHEQFVSGWSVLPPCFGVFMEGVSALSWPHRAGSRLDLMGDFHEQVFDSIRGLQPRARRRLRASPTKYEQAKYEANHHEPECATNHDEADNDKPVTAEADAGAKIGADTSGAATFGLKHAEAQSGRRANSLNLHDARIQAGTAEVQADRSSKPGCNQAASADNSFRSKIYGDNFSSKNHHDCDHVGS
jgi:hypothetical protein